MLYKNTCMEFCQFCVKKMPGSQFDKFYIAEMVKKFPKQEDMDELFATIKGFDDDTFESQFQKFTEDMKAKSQSLT